MFTIRQFLKESTNNQLDYDNQAYQSNITPMAADVSNDEDPVGHEKFITDYIMDNPDSSSIISHPKNKIQPHHIDLVLSGKPTKNEKIAVASHPEVIPYQLDKMMFDPDIDVRTAVASSPNLSTKQVIQMIEVENNPTVIGALRNNPLLHQIIDN